MGKRRCGSFYHNGHRMISTFSPIDHRQRTLGAALPRNEATRWLDELESTELAPSPQPPLLERDAAAVAPIFAKGRDLCARLPLKSKRSQAEREAGESLVELMAGLCRRFCRVHREAMYRKLTADYSRFLRCDALVWQAGELWPGVIPSRGEVAREAERMQMDKDGLEIHQGIFFSQILSGEDSGIHLLHAMLRPKAESLELLQTFRRKGVVELDGARVEAHGEAATIFLRNPNFLNAEDAEVSGDQETAVDLVLLHPEILMGILRGAVVDHPRYRGRRVFDSGINLTKIYHGKMPYLFYLNRDVGMYSKVFRGLTGDTWRTGAPEETVEKPWLAAVDSHAIGGGCQLLLVVDYVIAESGAYFSLPARKEGIIPGAANLRLPRFLGERMARQAIMFDKTFYVDNPDAAGLVNEVVPREAMDAAVQRAVENALGSGMVSAAGNRKALRVQSEPLDSYRRYMAVYCEEQAWCHLSPQLIANLEKHWNAKHRRL